MNQHKQLVDDYLAHAHECFRDGDLGRYFGVWEHRHCERTMTRDDADRDDIIEAYLARTRAQEQGIADDAGFWAVEAMWEIVDGEPEAAWTVILEMIGRAEGDYQIASIAAGPLEDFIVRHGWQCLDKVEREARANPKFRRALVGVWGESRMPEELVLRLRALVQGEPPL